MISAWPRRLLVAGVRAYQIFLSPSLGASCRFAPTCSHYAIEALRRHGAVAGSALAVARIARCAPWCAGGHDPVPLHLPRLFSSLLGAAKNPSPPDPAGSGPTAPTSP